MYADKDVLSKASDGKCNGAYIVGWLSDLMPCRVL